MTSFSSSVISGFHNDFEHSNVLNSIVSNGRKTLNVLQDNVLDHSNIDDYCNSTTGSSRKQAKKSTSKLNNNRMHNPAPVAVARRNARERNRVKQVNNGFATLQKHIPKMILSKYESNRSNSNGAAKKLSKVETLRMAVEYIRSLENILSTSSGTSTTDSNIDDFSFTDDSLSLVSQLHEDSNSESQFYEYTKQELLSPQPQPLHQQQQPTLSLTLPAVPSLVPLSSDDSLLIENNFNFQNLMNTPNEIILESDSIYESSFNNNNTNQNRNFVIMKTQTDTQNAHQIVDCGNAGGDGSGGGGGLGPNVIIWWQPNQDQQPHDENQQQPDLESQQSLT